MLERRPGDQTEDLNREGLNIQELPSKMNGRGLNFHRTAKKVPSKMHGRGEYPQNSLSTLLGVFDRGVAQV